MERTGEGDDRLVAELETDFVDKRIDLGEKGIKM